MEVTIYQVNEKSLYLKMLSVCRRRFSKCIHTVHIEEDVRNGQNKVIYNNLKYRQNIRNLQGVAEK